MLTGISTLADLSVPLPRLLQAVAAAGFECASLSHSIAHCNYLSAPGRLEARRQLERAGLRLNYIHPPIQPYYDLSSTDEQLRQMTVALHKLVIDACAELGGRAVTAHLCNEKSFPPAELEARTAAGLRSLDELGPAAATAGVYFCVENLPGGYSAQEVTLAVLRACERPDVHVTLDSNHAWIGSPDPRALADWLAPRVRSTHISDTLGSHDSHLLPGAGCVDFAAVGASLGRAGFGRLAGEVLDLECSLGMQRQRLERGRPHPGDPDSLEQLPSLEEYLHSAAKAARRFAQQIEAAYAAAA